LKKYNVFGTFGNFIKTYQHQQESLANGKVRARQQRVYKGSSEDIYGKSTQGT